MPFPDRGPLSGKCLREYLPELERVRALQKQSLQTAKEDSMSRLMKDLAVDRARNPEGASFDRWDADDEEDEGDDDGDINIIDRSKWAPSFVPPRTMIIPNAVSFDTTLIGQCR